jgi:glycerol uptake facilitator-like aquaporin
MMLVAPRCAFATTSFIRNSRAAIHCGTNWTLLETNFRDKEQMMESESAANDSSRCASCDNKPASNGPENTVSGASAVTSHIGDESCDPSKDECIPIDDVNCIRLAYSMSPAPLPEDSPELQFSDQLRKLSAEVVGTLLLVMIVVGSGIMAERTSGDVGVQLLINSIATVAGLYGLITIFGPISGAHFNPCVSLVDLLYKDMALPNFIMYSVSQILGAILGCLLANLQFDLPAVEFSTKERYGFELWISEIIATSTLILMIHGCIRTGYEASVPAVVSLWVGGGYFFTNSSIFANPAVTIGRMFTDSFAGIEPKSAFVYIPFQVIGALVGFALTSLFYPLDLQPPKKGDNLYRRACVLSIKDFINKKTY